jgi:hypothetical protein
MLVGEVQPAYAPWSTLHWKALPSTFDENEKVALVLRSIADGVLTRTAATEPVTSS